jgi:hypothetical protein
MCKERYLILTGKKSEPKRVDQRSNPAWRVYQTRRSFNHRLIPLPREKVPHGSWPNFVLEKKAEIVLEVVQNIPD